MNSSAQQLIDQLWDFGDPSGSESRLRTAFENAIDPALRLELQTQIARAQGLQRSFELAHQTLDEVKAALDRIAHQQEAASHVRYLLERGRVFNSANQPHAALSLFEQAYNASTNIKDDHLAVDAAHMIGIVHANGHHHDEAMKWNLLALQIADSSEQPRSRQWRGSLHNNIGWTLHDQGNFAAALSHFESALAARIAQGKLTNIRIARWCVARCLRSLNRTNDALTIQLQLQVELIAAGQQDGFVQEELGECLLAMQRPSEAAEYFAAAYRLLQHDSDLVATRLQRLAKLSESPGG